jgi:U3 small nucleolar RNA-associated protein 14
VDSQKSEDTEGEDEGEVGDDEEFMNLVDVLDGKGEINAGSDEEKISRTRRDRLSPDSVVEDNKESWTDEDGDEDDDEEEDEGNDNVDEEEEMAFAPSEDEESPDALEHLQNFVSNLDVSAKKRKAPHEADGDQREGKPRKRRLLQEKTEAGEENEFNVRSSGT